MKYPKTIITTFVFGLLLTEQPIVAASEMGAVNLNSAAISGTGIALSWINGFDFPEGGYDVIIDGLDIGSDRMPTSTTSATISGLDLSQPHCFTIKSRYTNSAFFPLSNQRCTEASSNGNLPKASLGAFSYKGAFKIDHNTQYGDSFARYASAVFEVSSDATSFFFAGKKHDTVLGQFQFPLLSGSSNPDDLNTSPILQGFSSFLGTNNDTPEYGGLRLPTGNPQINNVLTGMALANGKLIINAVKYYDADARNTHTTMLITNPSDLANSPVYGFFSLEGLAHAAGWISEIPSQWQAELGGKYITGWASNLPIASRNSYGPSAFVVDIDNISPSTSTEEQITTTTLMDFSTQNMLHSDEYNNQETVQRSSQNQDTLPITIGTNNLWTVLSWAVYGFIIPDSRTYAVFGSSGGHDTGIGYKILQSDASRNCSGPCANERSDYYNYYWLFDVYDLLAVKHGRKLPHEVRPYAYGKFPTPFQDQANILSHWPDAYRPIRGGDYDVENKVLYLVLGGSSYPEQIIIAYDVLQP